MPEFMMLFISGLANSFGALYCSSKILDKKCDYKDKKYWLGFFILLLYVIVIHQSTTSIIRIIIFYLLLLVINLFLFKPKFLEGLMASFFTMMIVFVSEIFYIMLVSIFMVHNLIDLKENFFDTLTTNLFIIFIMTLIINIKPIQNTLKKITKTIQFKGNKTIFFYSILLLTTLSVLLYYIYFEVNFVEATIFCFILVISFSLLTLYLFKERSMNQKLQFEYDILLNNLEEYEGMYQLQRMMNHDYKSELSEIRGMVHKNNTKLLGYIDELIDVKPKKTVKWMDTLKLIPDSALRGLLYYKFAVMEQKNIQVEFDISKKVTVRKFKKINFDLNKKICKILGIYLDNAIQAVESLKERYIKLSIYLDVENTNILVFSIMNNYEGFIDLDKINDQGYSTKGKGRGLGLSMVEEILLKERKLNHQTRIIRNNFIQELEIELQKNRI